MASGYQKVARKWTDEELSSAVDDVIHGRLSLRGAGKQYRMSTTRIRKAIKERSAVAPSPGPGTGTATLVPPDVENSLAELVRIMIRTGFPPLRSEIATFVQTWIKMDPDHRRIQKFTANDDLPGPKWIRGFLARHQLSLKRTTPLQLSRKAATEDPFIIFEYFGMLEREVGLLGLADKPERVFNCDETSFCRDPKDFKVVGIRGEKTFRIRSGAGRSNTTVLATSCADGTCMDPYIVFRGKNRMRNEWKGETPECPETGYAVSEKGWMTSDVFECWFEFTFLPFLQSKGSGPALLILDGHVSHLGYHLLDIAIHAEVTIVKMPPHTTDLLQPLDVSCFKPVKSKWNTSLFGKVRGAAAKVALDNSHFATLLSSVWREGLTEPNIKRGFETTGTFPVDRTKYKLDRLDKAKLDQYNSWVADGKPLTEDGDPDISRYEPQTVEIDLVYEEEASDEGDLGELPGPPRRSPRKLAEVQQLCEQQLAGPSSAGFKTPQPSKRSTPPSRMSSADSRCSTESQKLKIPSMPNVQPPPGFRWELGWQLVRTEQSSFSEAILQGRDSFGSTRKRFPKGSKGVVATGLDFLTDAKAKAEKKAQKEAKKKAEKEAKEKLEKEAKKLVKDAGKGKAVDRDVVGTSSLVRMDAASTSSAAAVPDAAAATAKIGGRGKRKPAEDISDESNVTDYESESEESSSDETFAMDLLHEALMEKMGEIRDQISEDDVGSYYAVYYEKNYFWGRVERVVLADSGDTVSGAEFKFLERKAGGGPRRWKWPANDDKEKIAVNRLFDGPTMPKMDEQSKELLFIFKEDKRLLNDWIALRKRGLPDA